MGWPPFVKYTETRSCYGNVILNDGEPSACQSLMLRASDAGVVLGCVLQCFKDLEGAVPMFELVVARFKEPLDWLADVPSLWSITIYNKVRQSGKHERARCISCIPSKYLTELVRRAVWLTRQNLTSEAVYCRRR